MAIRRALGATVAGIGSVAAANRLLRARADRPGPPLDGDSGVVRWRGMDVAVTEAGDPEDPDLVCLHGINAAGSSHEFRGIFADLAEDHHVIAPDLPGFGLSDRPPLRYTAALYEDFVREFLVEYDAPTVVAASLSGAYVAGVAGDLDLNRLFLICPTATAFPGRRPLLRGLLRAPVIGTGMFHLLTARPAIRYFDRDHGYYDPTNVTEDLVDYQWELTHQPGARYAQAAFVAGDLNADVDLGERLAALDIPVTLVWGREAETTPLSTGRELAERTGARLVVFDDARLLPHVEFPEAFVETLREELASA